MKKNICILAGAAFAIAIYWLGFVNGVYYNENKIETMEDTEENVVLSDEELVNRYIDEKYGSEYYGVLWIENDDDEFIDYEVYDSEGSLTCVCTTHRSWLD